MKPVRFPRPLVAGDLVAVVAPSSGVREAMHPRLDLALDRLRGLGLRVREGRSLRRQLQGASASAAERAQELMEVLLDPEVAAVLPPWGGERAIELLPLLDFERLAQAEPKWLSGFSDLSTLQLPLLLRSGWASIHGPNLMQLGDPALDACSARVFEAWRCGSGSHFNQRSSGVSDVRRLDGGVQALHLEGRLLGGCLDSVSRLSGSSFGAVPGFGSAGDAAGSLLFFENAELKPFELARALQGLRLAGWFEQASGLLLGRNAAADLEADFSSEHALQAALSGLTCPVLLDLDIGHVGPQWSLVQGARAQLSWSPAACQMDQWLA
ncbi:MAG: LD-carboxypeptidase [Paucibacter sp.]|nr:LD-carboxypeptidase [Roseateles sp.]